MNLNSYLGKQQSYGANPMDYFGVLDTPQTTPSYSGYTTGQNADTVYTGAPAMGTDVMGGLNQFWKDNQGLFGQGGLVSSGLGLGKGILDTYLGLSALSAQKQNNAFQRDMATKNYNVQKGLTNERLETRQAGREAFGGRTGKEAEDNIAKHMAKYGVA